jgi:hypothetical protein
VAIASQANANAAAAGVAAILKSCLIFLSFCSVGADFGAGRQPSDRDGTPRNPAPSTAKKSNAILSSASRMIKMHCATTVLKYNRHVISGIKIIDSWKCKSCGDCASEVLCEIRRWSGEETRGRW